MAKKQFEDIVFFVTDKGDVKIEDWPDYAMSQDELIRKLRELANNIKQIKL